MTNVPVGAGDRYYVYRPVLDLIGFTEGTDKGRSYNETLAYGAYTGGNVNLVGMTLSQVDALQTKMLKHPKNTMNSSALGRYQIVRTTLRAMRKTLDLDPALKFDAAMQDRLACFLLGQRGIDKYLAGRLSEDTLINNLAKEWASLPQVTGKGAYSGQNAAVKPSRVRAVLTEARKRHAAGQPVVEVKVPVEKKVPVEVPVPVKTKDLDKPWYKDLLGQKEVVTTVAIPGISALGGVPWQNVAIIAGLCVIAAAAYYIIRRRDAAKQEAQVQAIHADAAEVKAAM